MRSAILLLSWLLFGSAVVCGQNGGGVYLEENSACIGSVIKKNGAGDGFGVAGSANAQLVNCTVVENELYSDTSSFILPGYIYCADGQIVSWETYREKAEQNAIGIVFWVNGATTGPRGAVIALDESKERLQWGTVDDILDGDRYNNLPDNVLRDTCCYESTLTLVDWNKINGNASQAATYCWNYKAYFQTNNPHPATENIRWCMPAVVYLKLLGLELANVRQTLDLLRENQSELSCLDFHMEVKVSSDKITGEVKEGDYYWSVNDGYAAYMGFVYVMNMTTRELYYTEDFLEGVNAKEAKNWVRPIFIF